VHLSRIAWRTFDAPAAYLRDPGHRAALDEYLSDLVRPYRLALRPQVAAHPDGQSYGEMAEELLRAAVPADEPVDLLVLAFAVPDVRPGRATATYLSLVCPGRPMAFAICDQGPAAAFTGLRLLDGYLAAGGYRRAALLVVEQPTLHYPPAAPVPLPARATAVALVCQPADPPNAADRGPARAAGSRAAGSRAAGSRAAGSRAAGSGAAGSGAAGSGAAGSGAAGSGAAGSGAADDGPAVGRRRLAAVRQHAGVAPDRAAALLHAQVAELAGGYPGATVVLGGGLPAPAGYRVRTAPPVQPDTGVWTELAAALDGYPPGGRVLVASYDSVLRYLCLLAVDC
jgi:hypothetical protein